MLGSVKASVLWSKPPGLYSHSSVLGDWSRYRYSVTVHFWSGWSSLVELICSLTVRIFSPPFVPSSASHSGLDVLITLTEWKFIPAAISDSTDAAQRKAWHDLHAAWMLCACQSLTEPDIWWGCEWYLLYFQLIEWLVLTFVRLFSHWPSATDMMGIAIALRERFSEVVVSLTAAGARVETCLRFQKFSAGNRDCLYVICTHCVSLSRGAFGDGAEDREKEKRRSCLDFELLKSILTLSDVFVFLKCHLRTRSFLKETENNQRNL